MNIITMTAFSNFRKNKSRNILIGIAIGLTALLLTVVPTVIFNYLQTEFEAVGDIYPTYHAMYRNVDEKTADKMKKDTVFEKLGLREDVGSLYCEDEDIIIPMIFVDRTARELNKQKIETGKFPEKENEIAVSEGLLRSMGLSGKIGDSVKIPYQLMTGNKKEALETKEFVITGFTKDSDEAIEKGIYTAYVSEGFADTTVQNQEHSYRVYFRLANTAGKVTDELETELKKVGQEYGVQEKDIVDNGTYLTATYIDPAFYAGVGFVLAVVMVAGVVTIYSIYYVSMFDKVQEYGRLRAIGATKKQIRKLVFREGFTVYLIAAPAGILLGLVSGVGIVSAMIKNSPGSVKFLGKYMEKIWEARGIGVIKWEIVLFAILVSFITVYLSLLRPMQIAGKISAIEAIRFQNADKTKKEKRKGYSEIDIRKLTAVNLGRNKRRTLITIVSLSVTGIMFMVIATVLSCMNPEIMARDAIQGEVSVSIDSWEDDEMHPERALKNIQKNNPLTAEFKQQLASIDGVNTIETIYHVAAEWPLFRETDGRPLQTGIGGIPDEKVKELEKYVLDGDVHAKSLMDGTGIILDGAASKVYPEFQGKIGDKIQITIKDGERTIEKELEIAAVVLAPNSIIGNWFNMPNSALQNLCQADITDRFELYVEKGKEEEVSAKVEQLLEAKEFLEMNTYQKEYDNAQLLIGYMMYGCYGMLFIFGLIGILNLINTMINSVHVRRKELGMLQAIGMSGRQTVRMLQMEGFFYTAGTLLVSLGLGSAAGYGVFLWAKTEQIMSIKFYYYPWIPALVLTFIIVIVQILVTYLVNHNMNKQSLIDRIRFSE